MKSGNSCFIFAVETVSSHHAYSLDWKSMYLCGSWNTGAMRIPRRTSGQLHRGAGESYPVGTIQQQELRGKAGLGHFRETGSKFRRSKWNADSDSQSCTASRSEAQLKNWNRCQTKTPQQLDTVHLILDY